jgi:hypothetical protein
MFNKMGTHQYLSQKVNVTSQPFERRGKIISIGLYHPLDGIANPVYKLLHFLTNIFFCNEKKALT